MSCNIDDLIKTSNFLQIESALSLFHQDEALVSQFCHKIDSSICEGKQVEQNLNLINFLLFENSLGSYLLVAQHFNADHLEFLLQVCQNDKFANKWKTERPKVRQFKNKIFSIESKDLDSSLRNILNVLSCKQKIFWNNDSKPKCNSCQNTIETEKNDMWINAAFNYDEEGNSLLVHKTCKSLT